MRKFVLSMVAVAAVATGMPANANQETLAAVNNGLAGAVATSNELTGSYRVSASCTFGGVLTPSNTLIVGFGGTANANGPANNTLPLLTAVECEINNSSEGGSESQTQDFSMNGAATAAASSTLLATSGPKEWPVKDITVCVSGFAVYGPMPVKVVQLARTCATPNG